MEKNIARVAFLLHSLDKDDSNWILSQLENGDSAQLRKTMKKLQQNSIFHDGVEVGSALREVISKTDEDDFFQQKKNIEKAIKVLNDAPVWITAALLGDAKWGWVEGYVESIDYVRKASIASSMNRIHTNLKPIVARTIKDEIFSIIHNEN